MNLLIAEDDEDDFLLTKDVLAECCPHIQLYWVKDGEELMDFLLHRGAFAGGKNAPRPAIILLDLNMPKKDGREALKEIKNTPGLRAIPVVALTTSNAETDVQTMYEFGANSFLRKPVGYGQFLETMKVFDQYWFDIVRLPAK